MIDTYQNLSKISVNDGKYYDAKEIENIQETKESITITTSKRVITIPKTAISKIEYYRADADEKRTYR